MSDALEKYRDELVEAAQGMDASDILAAKKERVLELLADGHCIMDAAEEVGRNRRTTWEWRKDPEYAKRWREAIVAGEEAKKTHTLELRESLGDKALKVLHKALTGTPVLRESLTAAIFVAKAELGMIETSRVENVDIVPILDDIPDDA